MDKEGGVKIMFTVICSCAESGLSNCTSIASSVPRMPKQRLLWLYGTQFLSACTHLLAVTQLLFNSLQLPSPEVAIPLAGDC